MLVRVGSIDLMNNQANSLTMFFVFLFFFVLAFCFLDGTNHVSLFMLYTDLYGWTQSKLAGRVYGCSDDALGRG